MRTFTAVVVAALAVGIHAEEGLDAALAEVERLKNQAERTRRKYVHNPRPKSFFSHVVGVLEIGDASYGFIGVCVK
jgi:hypothetical protein